MGGKLDSAFGFLFNNSIIPWLLIIKYLRIFMRKYSVGEFDWGGTTSKK